MTRLPLPDAWGIYTFPLDLLAAHDAWMKQLPDDAQLMELTAPLTGDAYRIGRRSPTGRPVVAIEPHHDDFSLSASGLFLTTPRPLTVITVFTRSRSVHPALEDTYPDVDSVSTLRESEAARALAPLGAERVLLGHKDADPPYRAHQPSMVDQITAELSEVLQTLPGDPELIAPASVTRHPDHLLVHEAARRLGCRWFWEDVAFWPTYALSGCDQSLFLQRTARDQLTPEIHDVTPSLLDKVTLLHMHGSQMYPVRKMYRPIRHAHTVAAASKITGAYAERFYRIGGTP